MKRIITIVILLLTVSPVFAEIGLTYGTLNRGLYIDAPIQKSVPRSLGLIIGTQNNGTAIRYERTYDETFGLSHSIYTTESRKRVFYAVALAIHLAYAGSSWTIVYEIGARTAPVQIMINLRVGLKRGLTWAAHRRP